MKVFSRSFAKILAFISLHIYLLPSVFAAGELQQGLLFFSQFFSDVNLLTVYETAPIVWEFFIFFIFAYHFILGFEGVQKIFKIEGNNKPRMLGSILFALGMIWPIPGLGQRPAEILGGSYFAIFVFAVAVGTGAFRLVKGLTSGFSGEGENARIGSWWGNVLAVVVAVIITWLLISWLTGGGGGADVGGAVGGFFSSIFNFFRTLFQIALIIFIILLFIGFFALFPPVRRGAGRVVGAIERAIRGNGDEFNTGRDRARRGPMVDIAHDLQTIRANLDTLNEQINEMADGYRQQLQAKISGGLTNVATLQALRAQIGATVNDYHDLRDQLHQTLTDLQSRHISNNQQNDLLQFARRLAALETRQRRDFARFENRLRRNQPW